MAKPSAGKVPFQKDIGRYFRDRPISPFFVYDSGLQKVPPWEYGRYNQRPNFDTVVVKVGTDIVTHKKPDDGIYNMRCVAEDLTGLRNNDFNVLLVTSGAIGIGREIRQRQGESIPESEKCSPRQKQLDAIAGQTSLFDKWRIHFYYNRQDMAESLVTHEDFSDGRKNKRLLDKYKRWLDQGRIPVINEDDAKSLEEIDIMQKGHRVFSDNDILSSLISISLKDMGYKPLLVLLTSTDGIYNVESFSRGEYRPIRFVMDPKGLEGQMLPMGSKGGRGGIISKIKAGTDALERGIATVIANGQYCNHGIYRDVDRKYRVLDSVVSGEVVGTRFMPHGVSK